MSHTTSSEPETPPKSAEQLRLEMKQIRRELGGNVEVLVENAERLMDWKYYAHRYPWAMVGVAAFLGYILVPSRTVVLPSDDRTLEKLAARMPVVVKHVEPEKKKATWMGSLMNMALNAALRAGQAYLSQQVGKVLAVHAANQQQPQPHQPAEYH